MKNEDLNTLTDNIALERLANEDVQRAKQLLEAAERRYERIGRKQTAGYVRRCLSLLSK